MRVSRLLPIVLAVGGIVAATASLACGDSYQKPPPSPSPGTGTATQTATNTASATATATVTPSPTPYDGKVMSMSISRFNVTGSIEELGLTADGALDTPRNENSGIAWYPAYDKPGHANPTNAGWVEIGGRTAVPPKGNSVFSAHVYYHNQPAPFRNLFYQPRLAVGDGITITMEDGRVYDYKVIDWHQYNKDTIPMGEIIWPSAKPPDKEWITLISCGGQFDSSGVDYVDRIVVVAERVGDDATAGT